MTFEEAVEEYKSFDDWKYADREAAWKWMYERGRESATLAEREACAKVCESEHDASNFGVNGYYCANAIRARGEK